MTEPVKGSVYSFRYDRLGGRLIALMNGLRVSKRFGVDLWVYWPFDTGLGSTINDPYELFDAGFVNRHFIDSATFLAVQPELVRMVEILAGDSAAVSARFRNGQSLIADACFGIDAFHDENSVTVLREAVEIWHQFPLSAPIRQQLPDLRQRIGKDAIAYHIRRGDLTRDRSVIQRAWPDKYVPDDYYDLHIERTLRDGATPVLFSDDPVTLAHYLDRYPALVPASTLIDGATFTPGQRDFLELCAISMFSRIVAPSFSAFSVVAVLLGGGVKVDPVSDLSDGDRTIAGDRLFIRLQGEQPTTPPGEKGQQLVHLARHLTQQGRSSDAAQIVGKYIKSGLHFAYLFPLWLRLLLDAGNARAAVLAGQTTESCDILTRTDFAETTMLRAVAHVLTGDKVAAAPLAAMAIWRTPNRQFVADSISLMIKAGILHDGNFLATSPASLNLLGRPLRNQDDAALRDFLALHFADAGHPISLHQLDALQWDWSPFLRPIPIGGLANHPMIEVIRLRFESWRRTDPTPDMLSLASLFDLFAGQRAGPLAKLVELSKKNPDSAMVHHRLSLVASTVNKHELALSAAEAAADLAPAAPSHRAWRGLVRLRQQDPHGAFADLDFALKSGLALPRVAQLLAIAAERTDQIEVAKDVHGRAVKLAPRDASLRRERAEFFIRTGDLIAAEAEFDRIKEIELTQLSVIRPKVGQK